MSQDDDNQQTQEQPAEAPAPDGLMAGAALAEDKASDEEESISHLAEDAEQAEVEDEDTIYERPDWFPEKHWDEKEGPDLEGLVKSNLELEKKFHHGHHKAPENGDYDVSVLTEAGYDTEDPLVGRYLSWAQKHGINQAAFTELASEIIETGAETGAAMELNYEQERKALGQNADQIIKSNANWCDGLERKGVISAEEREELNIWGGTAIGQKLMQKVRSMTGDMSQIPVAEVSEAGQSKDEFDAEMFALMRDERASDPVWYKANVERRFEQRYPKTR